MIDGFGCWSRGQKFKLLLECHILSLMLHGSVYLQLNSPQRSTLDEPGI